MEYTTQNFCKFSNNIPAGGNKNIYCEMLDLFDNIFIFATSKRGDATLFGNIAGLLNNPILKRYTCTRCDSAFLFSSSLKISAACQVM